MLLSIRGIAFIIFGIPTVGLAGPRYEALLQKEEKVRICLENVRPEVATFYKSKYANARGCDTAEDCIYEPYGGGFTVNVATYKKYHTCFMTFQDFEGLCWSLVKGEYYTCPHSKSFPCFESQPVQAPTHYACVNQMCEPRYDGSERKWSNLYLQHFEGQRWSVDPDCRQEFQAFQNQLQRFVK